MRSQLSFTILTFCQMHSEIMLTTMYGWFGGWRQVIFVTINFANRQQKPQNPRGWIDPAFTAPNMYTDSWLVMRRRVREGDEDRSDCLRLVQLTMKMVFGRGWWWERGGRKIDCLSSPRHCLLPIRYGWRGGAVNRGRPYNIVRWQMRWLTMIMGLITLSWWGRWPFIYISVFWMKIGLNLYYFQH